MAGFIRKTLASGAIVLAAAGMAGEATAQSLNETLALAYKNSRLLDQNRALLRATDENAAQALAAIRPSLTAGASATNVNGPGYAHEGTSSNVNLSAAMTLYAGGKLRLGEDLVRENILAARESLRGVEQNVLLSAATAFFNLRKASQVVDLQKNNVTLLDREYSAAKDRFDVGAGTKTDVALAQAQLAAARSSLAAAQGSLTQAREAYKTAVGVYPTRLGSSGNLPKPAASLEAARQIARKTSPTITQAQHNVSVSDLNVRIAETAYRPTVGLSGQVTHTNTDQTNRSVTLSLNQPIYEGGKLDSLYRQAVARNEADRAALLQSVLTVEQGVGDAWSKLDVANASLTASEEQTKAAQLAFDGLREQAALGASTTLDVLNAEQSLLNAQTSRTTAVNDRYIAAYGLMAAMGILTAKNLNLPVISYDPAAYYESVKNAPLRTDRGARLDKVLKSLGKK